MNVAPFRIQVPQAALDDLRERLARTRWPDEVRGAGWSYGASLEVIRDLAEHWRDRFDWRAQEARLNSFAHFTAEADGQPIHFVHERGRGPQPMPLLLLHGWPGSFVEFEKTIPLLADPAAHGGDAGDAFDVIVPSLPGFGFSPPSREPGMSNRRMAQLFVRLMEGLGYARFGVQGGDFGAGIATWIAREAPERLAGMHLNYIPGSYAPQLAPGETPSPREAAFLAAADAWFAAEGAYAHAQMTKPQTLAYALNDSPAGLLAWIVEKFRDWGDCGGDVERRFTRDELLTNVTIYWVTQTIHASMRLYLESRRTRLEFGPGERLAVPCGVAAFPKEEPFPPREWIERVYRITHWTDMPSGGHFAAMEEPERLAADVRAFFRSVRPLVP
jgi:pimeloyl-ACP methyl ester carboxylesterase